MKFSTAFTLATLCTVMATEVPRAVNSNPMLAGVEGSITNSRQVMDTLTHQLKSHDGHAVSDVISAFLTGADSQTDNAIATISQALSPLTGGLSMAVGNFLLGPFVQSLTNGAEVMIANLIGMPFDGISSEMIKQVANYQKNIAKMSSMAAKNNVNTVRLTAVNNKLTKFLEDAKSHKRAPRAVNQNPMLAGVEGSITNSRQVMDTLNHQLQSHDGHAVADTVSAFLTGADSQIDNAIATVSQALSPLTGGLSMAVGNFLLGPFVQSLTNGAEVMIANLIGMPFDGISSAMIKQVANYQKNIAKMNSMAAKNNVNTVRLTAVNNKLTKFLADAHAHQAKKH